MLLIPLTMIMKESIETILLEEGGLTEERLRAARAVVEHLATENKPFALVDTLLEREMIEPETMARCLAKLWGLVWLDEIPPTQLDPDLLRQFPLEFLRQQRVVPVRDVDQGILIITADPRHLSACDAVQNILGYRCPRAVAPAGIIEQAISDCYYKTVDHKTDTQNDDIAKAAQATRIVRSEDLLNIANQPPVIRLVNMIFFRAVQARASDIHIEPYEAEVKVRFRIDGVLHNTMTLPPHLGPVLTSRLKVMANLDIAERRLPQDGQSRIRIGEKEMDIRLSTIPTADGERVVLRLLDKGHQAVLLDQLGLHSSEEKLFRKVIYQPHGIILLTGPTGSGKTTTLYAAISELSDPERNILTVEDPIEYQLSGVGQMQVKPKINLNFANCLRHILRQDPDVVMIGEIRDRETAEIAIQASLTGHMVFSTLHTNDSASAIVRLVDMGIEQYLISSSLTAVMAQRLVRSLCPNCKQLRPREETSHYGMDARFFRGAGCERCMQSGYLGRSGIFELLTIDETIREMINEGASCREIKDLAVQHGMTTLRQDGIRKAIAGVTSIEEVLRVTQDQSAANLETIGDTL